MSSKSLLYIASVFCVLCLLLFFFLREYLKRIVEVFFFFCQNMSKLSLIHSTKKAGPTTEIYGPRSEYGFLRTTRRPIRMQDSSKPYNKFVYHQEIYHPACTNVPLIKYLYYTCYTCVLVNRTPPLWYIAF